MQKNLVAIFFYFVSVLLTANAIAQTTDNPIVVGSYIPDQPEGVLYTIQGQVFATEDTSVVSHASVYIPKLNKGCVSDDNGRYSIALPSGLYKVIVRHSSMLQATYSVMIHQAGELDLFLKEKLLRWMKLLLWVSSPITMWLKLWEAWLRSR